MTNEVLTRLKKRHGNKMGLYLRGKNVGLFSQFFISKTIEYFDWLMRKCFQECQKMELEAGYFLLLRSISYVCLLKEVS